MIDEERTMAKLFSRRKLQWGSRLIVWKLQIRQKSLQLEIQFHPSFNFFFGASDFVSIQFTHWRIPKFETPFPPFHLPCFLVLFVSLPFLAADFVDFLLWVCSLSLSCSVKCFVIWFSPVDRWMMVLSGFSFFAFGGFFGISLVLLKFWWFDSFFLDTSFDWLWVPFFIMTSLIGATHSCCWCDVEADIFLMLIWMPFEIYNWSGICFCLLYKVCG